MKVPARIHRHVAEYGDDPVPDRLSQIVLGEVRHHGVEHATVRFANQPVWTVERISERGRELLADQFTVAVPADDGSVACPLCHADEVETRSPFGPTACRAIAYCASCVNPLEVMRR